MLNPQPQCLHQYLGRQSFKTKYSIFGSFPGKQFADKNILKVTWLQYYIWRGGGTPYVMWAGVLSEQQKLISDDCCICFGIYFGLLHIRRRPEDEGGGGNFYGNEIGAGWRHGVFKWTRLGDIGLCSVTDTGCHEDQQLPHRHYWGGGEGEGFFPPQRPCASECPTVPRIKI